MPDRIERLRHSLREKGLAAMLISAPASVRYFFGFTGSNALGVITAERSLLVTDWRYRDQAAQEVEHAEVFIAYRDLFIPLKEKRALASAWRVGFEEHHFTCHQLAQLRKHFPQLKLLPTERLLSQLAVPKEAQELAALRQAAAFACRTWEAIQPYLQVGVSEADLAAEIIYRSRKAGSEADPFEPIVASGPRSALPHGRSTTRRLQPGDMVVIDFGCMCAGYVSDITRTIAVGEPPARLREAYQLVKEAGERVYAAVRPDMQAVALDQVARDYLKARGLGEQFNHALGHGLGLDVHMLPRIGPESKDVIPFGSVLAIEPGVYLPGLGGVRIEDDILVTAGGCEILTPISRELICVE
ncbi:MAG: aminopeptidase P family protein [candidate division KSB1 bacterium]|nr:aminopeptidase P family protein [candidate division KSB1 bacterium]MDZ7273487.1 aminopeptidase P family protein [candidate division KSB1 bacterium]MDZ7286921.1 aminopeptidase P family protein [candidate division KSB1 bacterium]MDZ7299726.1 aminopeptidase P family protein [candidate division KSB1 bacterium]MDZ7305665.1 aminopeptidase P family protein [candidate division KSB1 bacterium]